MVGFSTSSCYSQYFKNGKGQVLINFFDFLKVSPSFEGRGYTKEQ